MGLFGKKKKEEDVVVTAQEESPAVAPPNPFPDYVPPRHNPYADQETFVPREYKPYEKVSQDPLELAARRKKERDDAILEAIFQAFAKMLPQYGTTMKHFDTLTTTDYAFNEGEYSDRYPDLERLIKAHMEDKGWKVKEFKIRNSKERSNSTLSKYYPKVQWVVMEPGSFKVKK